MGDRCDLRITYRPEDKEQVLEILFDGEDAFSDVETYHGAIEARVYAVNWGLYDELRELAEAGVPFDGWHSAGGSYGAALFVSDGNEYANCETSGGDVSGPVALVNENGSIDRAMQEEADLYWKLTHLADALLYPDYCPKCGTTWAEHDDDGACPPPPVGEFARLMPPEAAA